MEVTNSSQVRLSKDAYAKLRSDVVDKIDAQSALKMHPSELEDAVARTIYAAVTRDRLFLNGYEQRLLTQEIVNDMIRLGPIQSLIDDATVTDILINGPDQVLVERKGRLEATSVRFRDSEHLLNLAQRITSAVGRRIDESSPMVDARLADGSRVNIIAPPLSLNGICVSIRKFSRNVMSLDGLKESGAMSQGIAEFLKIAANARLNILVSGGTGSGKTTMLNALSQHIDARERIITIEDAAELRLDQPFVVRLETRPPSLEGKGEVSQRDLLKNALRMRPDRILVGEVRGSEAFDMLQAMNTGHDGSLSTVHANSPADAMLRLENMLNMGVHQMSSTLIRRQLASALDLLVQLERDHYGVRRITAVSEILATPDGKDVVAEPLYVFEHSADGQGGRHRRTNHYPASFEEKLKVSGLYAKAVEVLRYD
ncbi:MAG: CpaF family protein [Sutterellaceae bacterium]|nr:CpaF family protein [Sutterellaceae bacterium]